MGGTKKRVGGKAGREERGEEEDELAQYASPVSGKVVWREKGRCGGALVARWSN